jgi:hypothetical protein
MDDGIFHDILWKFLIDKFRIKLNMIKCNVYQIVREALFGQLEKSFHNNFFYIFELIFVDVLNSDCKRGELSGHVVSVARTVSRSNILT